MEDCRRLGVAAALDGIAAIVPDQTVHAVGYCLGGTLLSIAAAAMARDGDERLKTVTLLAAQVDFREAGELTLCKVVSEKQLAQISGRLWAHGLPGVDELRRHIDAFIARYNETARPFAWSKSEVHQKRLKPRFADL